MTITMKKMPDKPSDKLYAKPLKEIRQFTFDDKVAEVFPDMLKRSIPGYTTILAMISDLAERFGQANSYCYDLGCSLGAASLAMAQGLRSENTQIIAIDNSSAMIERCRKTINQCELSIPIELYCRDLASVRIQQASMVVLNFTLQFIPLEQRQSVIENIFEGMLPGGILLISEKIEFEDEHHQQLMTELYHNFKRANGYSELEVAQKRAALEKVLQPETINVHKQRLSSAGFTSVDIWFQCFTFASFIAIKSG